MQEKIYQITAPTNQSAKFNGINIKPVLSVEKLRLSLTSHMTTDN